MTSRQCSCQEQTQKRWSSPLLLLRWLKGYLLQKIFVVVLLLTLKKCNGIIRGLSNTLQPSIYVGSGTTWLSAVEKTNLTWFTCQKGLKLWRLDSMCQTFLKFQTPRTNQAKSVFVFECSHFSMAVKLSIDQVATFMHLEKIMLL